MSETAAMSFERLVKKRARCILGVRGFACFETMALCISAIDQAATRGKYTEKEVVETARQVADDTLRWRTLRPIP